MCCEWADNVTPKSRYVGEVGDVIVGRITEVGNKRWKVDVNARQEAVLQLGSINLPGGALRRRTVEDRLQMRQFFAENDIISCEVATLFRDGGMSIQTRSQKYGKLENGVMIQVPPHSIQRARRHFESLSCGADLVLGLNGYVWIWIPDNVRFARSQDAQVHDMDVEEGDEPEGGLSPAEKRLTIARVANCVRVLADAGRPVVKHSLEKLYRASVDVVPVSPAEMLDAGNMKKMLALLDSE